MTRKCLPLVATPVENNKAWHLHDSRYELACSHNFCRRRYTVDAARHAAGPYPHALMSQHPMITCRALCVSFCHWSSAWGAQRQTRCGKYSLSAQAGAVISESREREGLLFVTVIVLMPSLAMWKFITNEVYDQGKDQRPSVHAESWERQCSFQARLSTCVQHSQAEPRAQPCEASGNVFRSSSRARVGAVLLSIRVRVLLRPHNAIP